MFELTETRFLRLPNSSAGRQGFHLVRKFIVIMADFISPRRLRCHRARWVHPKFSKSFYLLRITSLGAVRIASTATHCGLRRPFPSPLVCRDLPEREPRRDNGGRSRRRCGGASGRGHRVGAGRRWTALGAVGLGQVGI